MQTALIIVFLAVCIGFAVGIFWRNHQKNAKFRNEIHQDFAENAQERRRKRKIAQKTAAQ